MHASGLFGVFLFVCFSRFFPAKSFIVSIWPKAEEKALE